MSAPDNPNWDGQVHQLMKAVPDEIGVIDDARTKTVEFTVPGPRSVSMYEFPEGKMAKWMSVDFEIGGTEEESKKYGLITIAEFRDGKTEIIVSLRNEPQQPGAKPEETLSIITMQGRLTSNLKFNRNTASFTIYLKGLENSETVRRQLK